MQRGMVLVLLGGVATELTVLFSKSKVLISQLVCRARYYVSIESKYYVLDISWRLCCLLLRGVYSHRP